MAKANEMRDSSLNAQARIADFWAKAHTTTPGKITSIFPVSLYHGLLVDETCHLKPFDTVPSYEIAAQQCRTQVHAIVEQCEHANSKFSDPEFDIEADFHSGINSCLFGLVESCEYNGSSRGFKKTALDKIQTIIDLHREWFSLGTYAPAISGHPLGAGGLVSSATRIPRQHKSG